jgi:transposase-like protein
MPFPSPGSLQLPGGGFDFPLEIRKIIYTIDIIEDINPIGYVNLSRIGCTFPTAKSGRKLLIGYLNIKKMEWGFR